MHTTPPQSLPNAAGWTLAFQDDFNGSALNRWDWPIVYGGSQYWNKAFWWDQRDVNVGNGELTVSAAILNGKWTAGGTTTMRWDLSRDDGFDFQYGRVEIHAKIDAGKGTGPAMLLWPFDNRWPPEIDIAETPDGQRKSVWFTNHWPGASGEDQQNSKQFKSIDSTPFDTQGRLYDGTAWHTYTIDWLPGKIIYYLDGTKLYETPPGEPVADIPMSLGLQMFVAAANDTWYGGAPNKNPRKVDLHVDYIKVYESDATKSSGDRAGAEQATATTLSTDASSVRSDPAGDGLVVRGTPRDEVLRGGPGPDVLIPGGGRDHAPDFVPGLDKLRLTGAPEQVKTFITTADGVEGVMVLHGGLNAVFLPGVHVRGGLAADDIGFA